MNFRSGVLRQPGSTTWRKRAGVAKGTIYLHFADKEELFQELVRTMLGPLVANLQELSTTDFPIRTVLERFVDVFVNGLYKTRRREVASLIISEGARFPKLAEFYYRQVIGPGMAAMRALLERASQTGGNPASSPRSVSAARGRLRGFMAIIWVGFVRAVSRTSMPLP